MIEPLDTAAIESACKDASDTLAQLALFEVATDDDQEFAAEMLRQVKSTHTNLDAERKRATKPMNEALRVTNGWFRPALDALLECERLLKQKISGYLVSCETQNRVALAAASEAATPEQAAQAMAVVKEVAPPAGVQVRKTWVWEVINADLVPAEYWTIDASKIQDAMRASVARDGTPEPIPGVRFVQEDRLAASRGRGE